MNKLYLHRAAGQLLVAVTDIQESTDISRKASTGANVTDEERGRDGDSGRKLTIIYISREIRENFATIKQEQNTM